MKDALGDDPAGPTALHKASLPPSQQDPEEAAAAAADSPGALGASVLLLVAVFALDCLRALRQSITREEAQAWARSFADDPHAVFALLARWCADLPFPPELALRLPSLLGALLYLAGALGLCRLAFGRGWLAFLGFGLLALDPLLFDLQSLGRGDGLGLGLMLCGALQLLRLLKGTSTGAAGSFGAARAIAASLLLGLAAASCAHTLPVALALLLTAAAATLAQRRRLPGGAAASGSSGLTLAGLALVGPPLAALLLWLPLRTAGLPASFSGSASLLDGARALGDASLAHQAGAWPLAPGSACFAPGRDALLLALGPVLLAALLWRLVRVLKRWRAATSLAELEAFERFHVLVGGSLLLAAALVVAGHSLLGLPWPDARSGAPLLVLALLCASGLAAEGWRRGGAWRAAALPALCALLALLLQFGSQVQIEEYWLWKQDAGARRCFEELRRRQDQSPRVSVRVAAAAPLQPALDFYRVAWRTGWMEPVRAGVVATKPDADFVVVDSTEGRSEALRHYSTLWQDSTGTVVLEAPRP